MFNTSPFSRRHLLITPRPMAVVESRLRGGSNMIRLLFSVGHYGPVITAVVGSKSPCSATGTAITVVTNGATTAGPTSGAALVPVYMKFAMPTARAGPAVHVTLSAARLIGQTAALSLETAPSAGGVISSNFSIPTAV